MLSRTRDTAGLLWSTETRCRCASTLDSTLPTRFHLVLRILMITDFYAPLVGGVEIAVRNLAQGLDARGHDVSVATIRSKGLTGFELDNDVRVHRIACTTARGGRLFTQRRPWAPPAPDPEAVRDLRRIVDQERPDVVHGHDWLARSFLPLKRKAGPAFAMSLHYYTLSCAKKSLMIDDAPCSGPALQKCLRCASSHYGMMKGSGVALANFAFSALERRAVDLFLPVSNAAARGNGLVGTDLCWEVIPNFVLDSPLSPASATLAALLPDEFLLFVGDLRPEKGIDVLLGAYRGLRVAPPLVLIGKTWANSPRALPPQTVLFEDWPNDAVREAQRRCLALVAPSTLREPFGMVALEAFAGGRPVIASRTGGLGELVKDGVNGLLVPPGDGAALAASLATFLDVPALRRSLADGASASAAQFHQDRVLAQVEAAYETMLARSLEGGCA